MESDGKWQEIIPDEHGDWLGQRDKTFEKFIPLGDKKRGIDKTVFKTYTAGVKTNRDAWAYNSSRKVLSNQMQRMISFYSDCVSSSDRPDLNDPSKISWSYVLRQRLAKGQTASYDPEAVGLASYRPFETSFTYYDPFFNENRYLMPKAFPRVEAENRMLCLTGPSAGTEFSVLMTRHVPNLHFVSTSQCFPRFVYEHGNGSSDEVQRNFLADNYTDETVVRDAITDDALHHFAAGYPSEEISKEDIFNYIYGLLHSEEYRERFADNLSKEVPRIPLVKLPQDFWLFVDAGRALSDLHVNYEEAELYPVGLTGGSLLMDSYADANFRVEKMRFGGKGKAKDKSTVIYNGKFTMTDIPLEAYDYMVNGKSALEWVMERQVVKTDKDSGIVNDANRYAIETVGDAAYPLKLFQRIITVSLETMKIVRSLPRLDI